MINCTKRAWPMGMLLTAVPCSIAAQPTPFDMQLLEPSLDSNAISTQLGVGWPLAFRVVAQRGAYTWVNGSDRQLIVVARDPVGCAMTGALFFDCLDSNTDEAFARLYVDTDAPSQLDETGDVDSRAGLVDSVGVPQVVVSPLPGITILRKLGPPTGGSILDGYGYGHDDDLPGLVMLANHGVGVLLDQNFNSGQVSRRRNLAGMLTWSAFVQTNEKGQTSLNAGAIVPGNLFTPSVLFDEAIGGEIPYFQPLTWYRVDGGPIQQRTAGTDGGGCGKSYREIALETRVEVRLFLVKGIAPDTLDDHDGDGDVDVGDAKRSGYTVLSNEAVATVNHWPLEGPLTPTDSPSIAFTDLDGNGYGLMGCSGGSGTGPGKLPPVPK